MPLMLMLARALASVRSQPPTCNSAVWSNDFDPTVGAPARRVTSSAGPSGNSLPTQVVPTSAATIAASAIRAMTNENDRRRAGVATRMGNGFGGSACLNAPNRRSSRATSGSGAPVRSHR
jgi:hypothetical protein